MASKEKWYIAPIARYLKQSMALRLLRLVSASGVSAVHSAKDLLKDGPLAPGEKASTRKEAEEGLIALTKSEIENGYPLLNAHALIGLWGLFEAMIEDLLVQFLMHDPALLENSTFGTLKIPLARFEMLEKEERMLFLLQEVERNTPKPKTGVDRFEVLLDPFGLSGPVEPDVKQQLLAMHHIRNILVHRASIADRRIIEKCPWLNLKVGETVYVNADMFERCKSALDRYVLVVLNRLNAKISAALVSAEGG